MFKRITKRLEAVNVEGGQRMVMIKAIRSCGIQISSRESTKNIKRMFVKVMEMPQKPYYDGVIEHAMLQNLEAD